MNGFIVSLKLAKMSLASTTQMVKGCRVIWYARVRVRAHNSPLLST